MMAGLKQSGGFSIPDGAIANIRKQFVAGRTGEAETSATISEVNARSGYLLDPHTAVAVHVARGLVGGADPVITLSTAHPAKFPAAVKAASGIEPALPAWLSDLYQRQERLTVLDNDQSAVEQFISARTRVLEEPK
jgi:threonine synthase